MTSCSKRACDLKRNGSIGSKYFRGGDGDTLDIELGIVGEVGSLEVGGKRGETELDQWSPRASTALAAA